MQQIHHDNIGLRARVAELAADPNAKAIAIGITAVALAPVVFPWFRPVLKAAIKSSVILLEKTKSAIAETGEVLADIAAEARAEAQAEAIQKTEIPAAIPAEKATVLEG